MIKTIDIPYRVSSDFSGYNFLAKLHDELNQLQFEQIVLNFSSNTWFEANLCAGLGAIINEANANFNQISIENLPSSQRDIFQRNHFLASFGGHKIEDFNNTTYKIP